MLLLAADLLLVAVLLYAVGRALLHGLARLRRRRRQTEPQLVTRRCDACHLAWQGEPGVDLGRVELLVRRAERRRARAAARQPRPWAKARGWDRCPSCLSTRVRTSGDGQHVEETSARLSPEALGWLVSGVGVALVGVAVAGLAAGG